MDLDTEATPIPTTNILYKPINEAHNFKFINTLVDKFYKFMADVYIEHKHLQIKQNNDLLAEQIIKPIQPFPQYFLYKLFYNYGVKRRMSNDYIALLYYSKTAKGYKNTEPITMLCRHMLIDLRYMRIISLGIPKSVKIDEFCNTYSIDKINTETNYFTTTTSTSPMDTEPLTTSTKTEKYRLYYFTEGTMMTYNPSLKKYNITIVNSESDDEDNLDDLDDYEIINHEHEQEHDSSSSLTNSIDQMKVGDVVDKPVEIKFNNQFMYSTRKILGTGSFGSNKSFLDMFEENNKIYNTDLTIIPSNLIKDTVLVFNIEHPENNIISTIKRNTNTLCAVFTFKPELESEQEFMTIINSSNGYKSDDEIDTNSNIIYDNFKILGTNMITQIQVSNYKKYLSDNNVNVNFYLPKIVKKFEIVGTNNTNNSIVDKKLINIHDISISQLENMVNNKSKYFHGYILYGINGERSKITNAKYKELCELKGNKPITLDISNNKNLFYLYCRLIKQKNVSKFLKEFDSNSNSNSENNGITYKKIFMWFYTLIHNYSLNLFKVYHYSFVKKTFNKPDIPYDLKPLCGDLHKMYKSNNTPVTNTVVEQYLFELPASKLFWRLFKNTNNSVIDTTGGAHQSAVGISTSTSTSMDTSMDTSTSTSIIDA